MSKISTSPRPIRGTQEEIPPGSKLVESLRHSGYNYWTATAELIDNSKDADAKTVKVDLLDLQGKKDKLTRKVDHILVYDDGSGMNYDELKDSHRLGSDRAYSTNDIGKFGLGGGVGAISIGRRIFTVTRKNGTLIGRHTDLDEIISKGSIISTAYRAAEIPEKYLNWFMERASDNAAANGTLVVIENLDLLTCDRADGVKRKLLAHFGASYYSFLMKRTLTLSVDDTRVEHSHPIMWDDPAVKKTLDQKFTVDGIKFHLMAVDLSGVSTDSAASKQMIKRQGGYFERGGRLLCGAVTNNPEMNVTGFWNHHATWRDVRWLLKFDSTADDMMGVGYSKKSIKWTQPINDKVAALVMPLAKNIHRAAQRATMTPAKDLTKDVIMEIEQKLNFNKNTSWSIKRDDLGTYGEATENNGTEIRLNERHALIEQFLSHESKDMKDGGLRVLVAVEKAFAELGEYSSEVNDAMTKLHKSISDNLAIMID
mgnify:CR=1 FL=1